MNTDDFPKQIHAPLKPIPPEWRHDILHAADAARRSVMQQKGALTPSAGVLALVTWLWPRPAAWAGLGAIWLMILIANLTPSGSAEGTSQAQPLAAAPPATTLSEQRALLSQLLDSTATLGAPADSFKPPRRRSERRVEDRAV